VSKPIVEFVNLKELHSKLKALDRGARAMCLRDGLLAAALFLEGAIKLRIEKNKLVDTGNLLNSIQLGELTISGDQAEVNIGTNVVYAAIHEFGGIIKARNAKALVFKTKDGRWHTCKSVTMPARPYMRPAMDDSREDLRQIMIDHITKSIQAAI
jgi:HK97 gp10 family phage protein